MRPAPKETGWIEVICGPMFSGKTEELIRRVTRARIARQAVQAFKPAIDDRYHATRMVSHSRQSHDAVPVERADDIPGLVHPDTGVVAVDEAQFFGVELVEVCEELADAGLRVIVAGLDQDYRGVPFGPMPQLMAVAEYVTKQLAICVRCGNPAGRSQRLVRDTDRVVVGAAETYEARCRACFRPEGDAAEAGDQSELDLPGLGAEDSQAPGPRRPATEED